MNKKFYSNTEFNDLKRRLNDEIRRRGTFKWWDPLTTPSVGEDKSSPLSLPKNDNERIFVDDKTYTINNPSTGSIEPTKNIQYPERGENPGGEESSIYNSAPNTSAALVTADEMRNYLIGLSKIQDINLFYGKDEIPGISYRDPQGIEDAVIAAENSKLNVPLHESDLDPVKNDPNGGNKQSLSDGYPVQNHPVEYPMENGIYVMSSGETDGEEITNLNGLGPDNFFDDYGAKPGDGNYHPYNRAKTPQTRRDWEDQNNDRTINRKILVQGGVDTAIYGSNPRNPNPGDSYKSRPVYGGVIGSCNVACTGLCYQSCDNQCSESCSTTCWNRCGNACTSTCGNVCTGCSTMCYSSCKTKCENTTGYACVKSGAKTIKITISGGTKGEPAKHKVESTTYTCQGCSYSCEFYPNKKTTCWDSGCMGNCFISCDTACSTSCIGGCVDNIKQEGSSYKTGKGRGCSAGCTINCVGICKGTCEGECVSTCWYACKQTCSDNCSYECSTTCGSGCSNGCTNGCTGCSHTCKDQCTGNAESRICIGCGIRNGCTSSCQHDCNKNCIGWGCRSICGVDAAGACEANCRINCMSSSCTALCSDACSNQCTTCVNTCGWGCGACTTNCSVGCSETCEIRCTSTCEHSCENNCVQSCSDVCGGCSNLCYSCVGMCIGICSVKCENGCSNCTNTCGWWCDSNCNRTCFSDCINRCISTCSGSCATSLTSNTTMTAGPERDPTANGYKCPHPSNREEERESFMLLKNQEES